MGIPKVCTGACASIRNLLDVCTAKGDDDPLRVGDGAAAIAARLAAQGIYFGVFLRTSLHRALPLNRSNALR